MGVHVIQGERVVLKGFVLHFHNGSKNVRIVLLNLRPSQQVAGVTCIFMNARQGAVAHRPRSEWTALSDAALFPHYFGQTCYSQPLS